MRYSAFISYNHRDAKWARWLHRALETYPVPQRLWGREAPFGVVAGRLPRVFRDREELASSADLAASVRQALSEAASLVVICSPNSAASRWVNEEVSTFIESGRGERIFCIIVDGEPHSGDPATECLPQALLAEGGPEPLAADARPEADGKHLAKLKLLAGILGVPYDELRQREAQRRQRRLLYVAAGSSAGLLLTSGLAVFAFLSRAEAFEQREIAERRTLTAERTLEFVKSMFKDADPYEQRGETLTVREVVDHGVSQLEHGLDNEPTVRVELGVTLAEVYGGLGLYARSDALLESTLQIRQDDPATRARQYAALGESRFRRGEYDDALKAFVSAARAAPRPGSDEIITQILVGMGQTQSALGNFEAADRALLNALKIDRARGGEARDEVARDLQAIGINKFYLGDLARAERAASEALEIHLALKGPLSPNVTDDRNTLAAIAHERGDLARAEALYRDNLAVEEEVLGAEHPDLAASLANLGRVMIERRHYRDAAAMFERAVRINLRERGEQHDDMAFLFSNLALAKRHLGQRDEARELFARAVATARMHDHPYLGPILADFADLECASGQTAAGLRYLDEADPLVAATFSDAAWRSAWVENVRGSCLLTTDRRAGVELIRRSSPIILQRWNGQTMFGFEAARRARQVRRG